MPLVMPKDDGRWKAIETKVDNQGKKFVLIEDTANNFTELRPYEQYLVEELTVEPLPDRKIVEFTGEDVEYPLPSEFIIRDRTKDDPLPVNEAKDMARLEEHFMVTVNGDLYSKRTNQTLSQRLTKTGYPSHGSKIGGRDGKAVLIKTHQAVARTFIPNPDNKPIINHIDGVKTNPKVTNLEWVTYQENSQHAVANGLVTFLRGTEKPNAKLTEENVRAIRQNTDNLTARAQGAVYGVGHKCILEIRHGRTYTNVV